MLLPRRLLRHDSHDTYALKLLLTTLITSTNYVNAIPITSEAKGDDSTSNTRFEIWLPIVLVVILVAVVGFFFYRNRGLRQRASRLGRYALAGAAMSSGSASGATQTRELTAEQLAGTAPTGTGTTAAGAAPTAANRTRRTRRPRRTPSQISTTSLPAYNKEPGEQELVVYRGPQDMEDVVILEGDGEDSLHSRNTSEASQYPPLPATPVSEPLLGADGEEDHAPSQPPGTNMPTRPTTTNGEPASSGMPDTSETRAHAALPASDPRGEAPAYSVIDLNDEPPASGLPAQTPGSPEHTRTASNESSTGSVNRRSGFRSLFGVLGGNSRNPTSPSNNRVSFSQQHTRNDSGNSMSSGGHAPAGTPARSRTGTHRASQSGSGSLLNLTQHLSRTRSNNTLSSSNHNLNNLGSSPSMISLNSISAPLSHTLTRTEMTFPKSGPTPEQLALISSRESLGRFGIPYGSEAIAFAASTSRADLAPPPEFEDLPRANSSLSVVNRPGSSLSQVHRVDEEPIAAQNAPSDTSLPQADTTVDASSSEPALLSPIVASPKATEPISVEEDEEKKPEVKTESQADGSKTEEVHITSIVSSEPPAKTAVSVIPEPTSTDTPAVADNSTPIVSTSPPVEEASSLPVQTTNSGPVVAGTSAPAPEPLSEFAPAAVPATSVSSKNPPTAFKQPTDFRPESRASSFRSVATFATAQQGYTDNETGASDYYSDDGNETETDGGDSRRNTLVLPR